MFGLFRKDPLQKLRDEYAQCRVQARDLQRNGDIKGFAAMSARVEELVQKIDEIEQAGQAKSQT